MARRNRPNSCATTGTCAPAVGSICAAKPKPAVFAIRSPAMDAAENRIVRIKPAVRPISSSVTASPIALSCDRLSTSGTGTRPTSGSTRTIVATIRTCSGTNRPPKPGPARINAPILSDRKKYCASQLITTARSRAGRIGWSITESPLWFQRRVRNSRS